MWSDAARRAAALVRQRKAGTKVHIGEGYHVTRKQIADEIRSTRKRLPRAYMKSKLKRLGVVIPVRHATYQAAVGDLFNRLEKRGRY